MYFSRSVKTSYDEDATLTVYSYQVSLLTTEETVEKLTYETCLNQQNINNSCIRHEVRPRPMYK
jgi:adenosine deaminase